METHLSIKAVKPACPDYFGELVEGGFMQKSRVRQAHPDNFLFSNTSQNELKKY
jgi:hypothetical protein